MAVGGAGLADVTTPLGALLGVMLGRAAAAYGVEASGARAAALVKRAVRRDLWRRLAERGPAAAAREPSGALATTFVEPVEALDGFVARFLPQSALAGIVPLMILLAVLPVSWAAALILAVTGPLVPFFMALVGMGAAAASRRQMDVLARMGGTFLDRVGGLLTLELYGQAERETARIAEAAEGFRKSTMRVLRIAFLSSTVLELLSSLSVAFLAVYVGMSLLNFIGFGAWGGRLDLFGGLFVLLLAPDFFQPLRQMAQSYHDRASAVAAAGRLMALAGDAPPFETAPAPSPDAGVPARRGEGSALVFEAVDAGYEPGRLVLRDVSFALRPGERAALVGPSGGGKSTVLALVLSFLTPTSGRVLLDGENLAGQAPEAARDRLAWVGQTPHLFHGTVRDNVLFARPDATEAELLEALDAAGLGHAAGELPRGLDTPVGEEGFGLSGGQARRVALARAYLKRAPLLLLDEPTAGLDRANERAVLDALARLAVGRTVLIASHSAAGIAFADRVIRIEDGRLADDAAHEAVEPAALERRGRG